MKSFIAAFLSLVVLPLCAETTELVFPVDIVTLGEIGTGTNDAGWVATALSHYGSDNKFALRFYRNDSRADSPLYPAPIRQIEITAFSSSTNLTRQLVVIPHPYRHTPIGTNAIYRCAATASTSRPYTQTVTWAPPLDIRRFSLAVEYETGARTGWGVASLVVHTEKQRIGFTISIR